MDSILLKDCKPASSLIVPEHPVPKALFPAIDVHSHTYVGTPAEIASWLRSVDSNSD